MQFCQLNNTTFIETALSVGAVDCANVTSAEV